MNRTNETGYINESLTSTPLPRACSTSSKLKPEMEKNLQKVPLDYSICSKNKTDDSLGLLSLSKASNFEAIDLQRHEARDRESLYSSWKTPIIQENVKSNEQDISAIELNHKRAQEILNNLNNSAVYRNTLKTPAHGVIDSTINESYFKTPTPKPLLSSKIHDISQKLMDTNVSLGEIFELSNGNLDSDASFGNSFNKFMANSTGVDENNVSDMFMPAGNAADQFLADELSIQNKHGLPIDTRYSIFSQFGNMSTEDKVSMGEFFRARTDDTSIFHNLSPEKTSPIPLLHEASQTLNQSIKSEKPGSALSITQINNLIANEDTESALEKLWSLTNKEESKTFDGRENKSLRHHKQFASSNDLRKNSDYDFNKGKLLGAKSMNCIPTSAIKEQHGTHRLLDKSLSSMRSTSSLDTLPDYKLPIECTRQELIWGCVKLGKSVTQEFFVRNKCHQRMRFQVSSTHPSYKISKGDSEPLSTVAIMLHPMESRQCRITYQPTIQGPHVANLVFYPVIKGEVKKTNKQFLLMYGYGGNANVDVQNISKDATGKLWLSLGCLDSKTQLNEGFIVKNSGSLPGFICLSSTPKSLCSSESVTIQPSELVLKPGEQAQINVIYKPNKQDFRHLTSSFACGIEVVEIAQIRLISGCEVIRSRLRRIHRMLNNLDLQVDPVIQTLHRTFKGEYLLEDLKPFKESIGAAKELLHQLTYKDISVTIEHDPDKTIMGGMEGFDETSIYHTLLNNPNNSSYDLTACESGLNVEPSQIILTPPTKITDSILITSESTVEESFKIKVEPEGIIKLSSMCGRISPGKTKILTLSCAQVQIKNKENVNILVLSENNTLEVSVKIIHNLGG